MVYNRRLQLTSAFTAFAFVCTTCTPMVFAQDRNTVRVALVDVGGNVSPITTDIHYFVQKGLRKSAKSIKLMPVDDVLNAGAQAQHIQNISFGKEALNNGLRAFNSAEYDRAADELGQAVTYFEQSFAFLDDPDDYIRALLHQGVCLARLKNKKEAIEVFSKALTIDKRADTSLFVKEASLFEKARRRVNDKPLSAIAVTSAPPSSRVFVNGGYRGVSPAYRPGLRQGVHFVRVERQGYGRVGRKVDTVSRRGDNEVKANISLVEARKKDLLDELLPGLQREFGGRTAGDNIKRLKDLLLVDHVILLKTAGPAEQHRVELALYNLNTGAMLKSINGVVDWDRRNKAAKNKVIELAKSVLKIQFVTVMNVPSQPAKQGDSVTSKWWFWTAIGAVALGGIVGIAVALSPDEQNRGVPKDGKGALLLQF